MGGWAAQLRAAAAHAERRREDLRPEHDARLAPTGAPDDLRDAVAVAVEHFGPDRLVCGSDWPAVAQRLQSETDRLNWALQEVVVLRLDEEVRVPTSGLEPLIEDEQSSARRCRPRGPRRAPKALTDRDAAGDKQPDDGDGREQQAERVGERRDRTGATGGDPALAVEKPQACDGEEGEHRHGEEGVVVDLARHEGDVRERDKRRDW